MFRQAVACAILGAPLCASAWGLAEPDGASGYKMLKLENSVPSMARSGAGVALPNLEQDANAAVADRGALDMWAGWSQGYSQFQSSLQQAGWVFPLWGGSGLGRMRFQGFDHLDGYSESDQPTGSYSASTWTVGLGWAHDLNFVLAGLRAGTRVHYGMNHVSDATSMAVLGDVGILWKTDFPVSVGVSVRNVGKTTTSGTEPETLPLTVQTGAALRWPLAGGTLAGLLDVRGVIDEDWTVPLAVEWEHSGLVVRTGTVAGRDWNASGGAGVQWGAWNLEAGLGWNVNLGLAPAMQLGVRF